MSRESSSLFSGFFDWLERLMLWLSSFATGGDADALCQIRAPLDTHTLVLENNSLLTMFRVIGSRRHIGPTEFSAQARALSSVMSTLLKAGDGGRQHSFVFGFRSDPSGGDQLVKEILGPSLMTGKRFGADVNFYFNDKLAAMSPQCVEQISVFGLVTHVNGLSPNELERWNTFKTAQLAKIAKTGVILDPTLTQTPMGPPPVMLARHNAAVSTLLEKVSSTGSAVQVMMDKMTTHETVESIRRFLDASLSSSKWRPQLLGDRPASTNVKRASSTFDHGLPIKVGRQLVTEKIREVFGDAEMARKGAYWYASITLDVFPQEEDTRNFSALTDSFRSGGDGNEIPFQVHFDISPNGLGYNQMEKMLASFVGAAGEHNKAIKKGFDQLVAMRQEGETVVALRAIFTTWSKTESQCIDRLSLLKSKVDSWGQAVTSNETGAPAHALLASAPAYSKNIVASYIPGPLSDMVKTLPVFMPSSVWKTGQLVPFTKEGRPYPIAFGSTLQSFWGTLIFAPTGTGKSFLMNMINAGVLFTPGANQVPMVTIVDKGPSSLGIVRLAKALLPPEMRDQVAYWRPTPNDTNFCINPWGTQHGCDMPLESDRDFLIALLGGIAPNLGPEGGKFLGLVINVAYDHFSRLSPTATRWSWSMDTEISEKLSSIGIEFNEDKPPRVWDVVDAFFKAGNNAYSIRAQNFAVPRMDDVTKILQDVRIVKTYSDAKVGNGSDETIIKVFERNIIAAANDYRVFFGVTKHTSVARFTVIDIEGMASASTSAEGHNRFGLMMLYARRLGAREYFLHPDDMQAVCPPLYKSYQMARVQKIREELKFIEYDEIHNARGIASVQTLLQKDAREGRKYNVVCILSSQDLLDFPEDLVKNSYNFFILGAGNASAGRDLQRTFDLTDSELRIILDECTTPGTMFGMFRTNRGLLSQLLRTRPSTTEKWAFNTNGVDMPLRDALYDRIGVKNTLSALRSIFPNGTARDYIDLMRNASGDERMNDAGITEMAITKLMPRIEAVLQEANA